MSQKAEKIQELYDVRLKDWEKSVTSISRKLTRDLDRQGCTYSLRSRVKTLESLLDKDRQQDKRVGRSKEKIKDLLGVRIAVPFLEDVETVLDVIKRRFEVLEIEWKAEKLSFREFAYDSVHVIIASPSTAKLKLPAGCLNGCEVQIRTILQDAWAEVEHELIYKSSEHLPDDSMGKKLAALNASLTLSDIIFQELRDHQRELRRWGSERFHELRNKAAFSNAADLPDEVTWSNNAESRSCVRSERNGSELTPEYLLHMALKAHDEKDYPKAVDLYTQALKKRPRMKVRATLYNHRGMAQFMLQNERMALSDFSKSFLCDIEYYPALNNRALIRRRLGHVRESLDDFARSLEIKSGQSDVHFMRSQTFVEIGELASALEEVKAALAIHPGHAGAKELKKRIQAMLGKPQGSPETEP